MGYIGIVFIFILEGDKVMNQNIMIAILLLVVLVLWTFMQYLSNRGIVSISPSDAKKRLDTEKGIILLDVRTKEEYIEKHLPKSILIPLNTLASEASRKLPQKNAEIFVYCRSGNRSKTAVRILLKQGYTNVYNLGGIVRWPYETVSGKR